MRKINWEKVRQAVTLSNLRVPKITFRTSAGGQYTCNQTGDKITQKGIESYKTQIWNFLNPQPATERKQKVFTAKIMGLDTTYPYYICPHCDQTHSRNKYGGIAARPFKQRCDACEKQFEVID